VSDLTFTYSGAALRPLLERLRTVHAADLERLDKQLATFSEGQRQAAMAPAFKVQFEQDKHGNIKPKRLDEQNDCARVMHARGVARDALRDTELWLIETYRTPKATWKLTLVDLGRLYPEQTARETLVAFQAASSGRGSWIDRLLARLAGWLSPRRQPARLPASTT